jgi:pilus assembly protein CpaB
MLALGCGLVASIGITQVINRQPKEVTIREGMTPILVAMTDIPMGELISSATVKLEPWPQDRVPDGAVTKLSEVDGRRSRLEIIKGEPVLIRKLLPKGATTSTATEFIPKGYRVVAVDVDKSDGAGLIMPGDRVDVLLHVRRNKDMGIGTDRTQTILQGIKVFAVGDVFKLADKEKSDVSITAKTISLLVTPGQAEKLDLASELGKIRLVMRSMEDEEIIESDSISVEELLGSTDGADRKKEEKSMPSKKSGILGMLNGMKTKQPEKDQMSKMPDSRTWMVRVLQGGEVEDVNLYEVKEGGTTHWRAENQEQGTGYSSVTPKISPELQSDDQLEPDVEEEPAEQEEPESD